MVLMQTDFKKTQFSYFIFNVENYMGELKSFIFEIPYIVTLLF